MLVGEDILTSRTGRGDRPAPTIGDHQGAVWVHGDEIGCVDGRKGDAADNHGFGVGQADDPYSEIAAAAATAAVDRMDDSRGVNLADRFATLIRDIEIAAGAYIQAIRFIELRAGGRSAVAGVAIARIRSGSREGVDVAVRTHYVDDVVIEL